MKPEEVKTWMSRYPWFDKLSTTRQRAMVSLVIAVTPEVFVGMRHVHKLMAKRVYKPMLVHLAQRTDVPAHMMKLITKEFVDA